MSECLKCGEPDETFCACGRQSEMAVASSELVVPLGKRAARREAKLKAAAVLQNLIMDGEFEESAKPLIWSFIDKLRAQSGKRHNVKVSDGSGR